VLENYLGISLKLNKLLSKKEISGGIEYGKSTC